MRSNLLRIRRPVVLSSSLSLGRNTYDRNTYDRHKEFGTAPDMKESAVGAKDSNLTRPNHGARVHIVQLTKVYFGLRLDRKEVLIDKTVFTTREYR